MRSIDYENLDTLNGWEVLAIEEALKFAISKRKIKREHGQKLLAKLDRFNVGDVLKYRIVK